MTFKQPMIRQGNKTMSQEQYDTHREQVRQANRQRYNANTRYTRDAKYAAFYQSKEWKNMRKQVLLRDKYLCQSCLRKGYVTPMKKGKRFYVHHIVELKQDWDRRLDPSNLETVCADCHIKEHRKRNK